MVKYRNPLFVAIVAFFTFPFYLLYWMLMTSLEMRDLSERPPDVWLMLLFLVPLFDVFVVLIYLWKYSAAVQEFSGFNAVLLYVIWIFFSPAAAAVTQVQLNRIARPAA